MASDDDQARIAALEKRIAAAKAAQDPPRSPREDGHRQAQLAWRMVIELVAGLGIGAFLITPWVAMNYGFAMRKPALTVIDGVNSVVGCGIMGLILGLF